MKRANYYILFTLFITASLIASAISYSQWTVCGNLSGITGRPTVSVVDENTAWVTGGSTVNVTYRTTDGGTNWTIINTTGMDPFFCLWAMDANTLFAGSNGQSGIGRIYKTTDGGTSWTIADSIAGGGIGGIKFSLSMPSFGFAVSGVDSNAYVFKTQDGGNTWRKTSFPLAPGYALSISGYNVIDSLFYSMGTTGGLPAIILTTNGGVTYNLQTVGLPSVGGNFTRGVAFNNDKLTGIAGATSFPLIARTTNGGINWENISVGSFSPSITTPVMRWIEGTNTCYLTSPYGNGVLKSINGGLNWTQMTTAGLGTFNMDTKRIGTNIYGFAVSFTTNQILKVSESITGSIDRFFANCTTPIPKLFTKGNLTSSGIHTTFGTGTPTSYTAMEFTPNGILYCIANDTNYMLQTLDTATGVLSDVGRVTGLPFSNNRNTLAYNILNNKMYITLAPSGELYSFDLNTRTATFIGLSGGYNYTDIAINSLGQCYAVAANLNQLLSINLTTGAATSIGNLGYDALNFVQGLCFDKETGTLYLSAWNNDSVRAELRTVDVLTGASTIQAIFDPQVGRIAGLSIPFGNTVGVQNISPAIPEKFSLSQNYPNPFNPNTKINYELQITNYVSLKVYDVLGKEVIVLVNEKQNAGSYEIDFDGSNLSSGVYFYKLEADGFADTKKMYLVK